MQRSRTSDVWWMSTFAFTWEGALLRTHEDVQAYIAGIREKYATLAEQNRAIGAWNAVKEIRFKLVGMNGSKCAACWLLHEYCACPSLPTRISPALCDASTGSCLLLRNRLKITLVMHTHEVRCLRALFEWDHAQSARLWPFLNTLNYFECVFVQFLRTSNTGRFIAHVLPVDARVVVWSPCVPDFGCVVPSILPCFKYFLMQLMQCMESVCLERSGLL